MAAEIKKNWLTTRMTVTLGLLIALEIVLSRFLSFAAWNMKIGFAFVPVALAAMLYGPVAAAIVGGLGDIIGALMFPIGPYAPGFTVTAVLMGLVLGFLLQKRRELWRVLTAVCVNQLVLSLFLNTLWISMLYSSAYWPLLVTRLVQCAILVPVQLAVILLMEKALERFDRGREL